MSPMNEFEPLSRNQLMMSDLISILCISVLAIISYFIGVSREKTKQIKRSEKALDEIDNKMREFREDLESKTGDDVVAEYNKYRRERKDNR